MRPVVRDHGEFANQDGTELFPSADQFSLGVFVALTT
jgi:hypothetical protein